MQSNGNWTGWSSLNWVRTTYNGALSVLAGTLHPACTSQEATGYCMKLLSYRRLSPKDFKRLCNPRQA